MDGYVQLVDVKRSGLVIVECVSQAQLKKALTTLEDYHVWSFKRSEKAPLKGVVDGIPYSLDARRFQTCDRVRQPQNVQDE